MTEEPSSLSAIEAAVQKVDALVAATEALTTAVSSLQSQRKRDWIYGIIALVLVTALGYLYVNTNNKFDSARDKRLLACTTSNAENVKQKALWDKILTLSDDQQGDTATREEFQKFLEDTFKLRDCTKV